MTECKVSDTTDPNNEIYAIHSFGDETCFDFTRLRVVQAEFGSSVAFDMRTFRFVTSSSSASEPQQQTVSCMLHLNPFDAATDENQAGDCECHTEDDCTVDENGCSINALRNSIPPNYQAMFVMGDIHRASGSDPITGHLITTSGKIYRGFCISLRQTDLIKTYISVNGASCLSHIVLD